MFDQKRASDSEDKVDVVGRKDRESEHKNPLGGQPK